MKLHNLCINQNAEVPNCMFSVVIQEGDGWVVNDYAREDDVFLCGRATGDHRRDITAKLKQLGIVRPVHAQHNSHMN